MSLTGISVMTLAVTMLIVSTARVLPNCAHPKLSAPKSDAPATLISAHPQESC